MPIIPAYSQRKRIRAALKNLLLNATRAKDRVFTNRSDPWDHEGVTAGELPAIAIYSLTERATMSQEAPREYEREVTVVLELLVDERHGAKADDELDAFRKEVEKVIFPNETALGTAKRAWYERTRIGHTARGSRPIMSASISMIYRYYTKIDETPDGTPDFSGIDIDYRGPFTPFRVGENTVGDPLVANTGKPAAQDEVDIL